MSKISSIEKSFFVSLFNRGGYVLNFNTGSFDRFTLESIGIPLCEQYGLSKGKSLEMYLTEAKEVDAIKLLNDLLSYYEAYYYSEIDGEPSADKFRPLYVKCRAILDRVNSNLSPFTYTGEVLKDKFSSEYISSQIDLMLKMQSENPTEAIGKAKELIESCCKTILEFYEIEIKANWKVSQLCKETLSTLEISIDNLNERTPEKDIIKSILGNLQAIAGGIAELRNTYGSGHGKSSSYKGLASRHAKLAVGSSMTLVNYLWDVFEWKRSKSQKN